jgi:hypothetical protein
MPAMVAASTLRRNMAMNNLEKTQSIHYGCEPLAGCVYSHAAISAHGAQLLEEAGERPHVIEMTARAGCGQEHRLYYALDLHQAAAKAAELLVRMRQQHVRVRLAAIRPASEPESEAFFAELAKYDGQMPGQTSRCRR